MTCVIGVLFSCGGKECVRGTLLDWESSAIRAFCQISADDDGKDSHFDDTDICLFGGTADICFAHLQHRPGASCYCPVPPAAVLFSSLSLLPAPLAVEVRLLLKKMEKPRETCDL